MALKYSKISKRNKHGNAHIQPCSQKPFTGTRHVNDPKNIQNIRISKSYLFFCAFLKITKQRMSPKYKKNIYVTANVTIITGLSKFF